MKEREPSNSSSWDFFDWNYVNDISTKSLIHNLSKETVQNSHFVSKYDPLRDGIFLSVYYKTPPGRVFWKQWTFDKHSFPSYQRYLQMS